MRKIVSAPARAMRVTVEKWRHGHLELRRLQSRGVTAKSITYMCARIQIRDSDPGLRDFPASIAPRHSRRNSGDNSTACRAVPA